MQLCTFILESYVHGLFSIKKHGANLKEKQLLWGYVCRLLCSKMQKIKNVDKFDNNQLICRWLCINLFHFIPSGYSPFFG